MAQTIIGSEPAPKKQETILPESYRHTLVESRYIPHTSLLSQISGTPTLVEWYRGSYGADEQQQSFEPESLLTYASYKRINNLIVKLDSGNGNYSFNPENGEGTLNVTGYLIYDLTPNKGDLFIKDIGDGNAGLFVLTEQPELRTIYADKCYYFEATIKTTVTKEIYDNLSSKVIEELYYSKDSAINGGNAVLSKTDVNLNKKIYELQAGIVDEILANHYYNDEKTIVIPNEYGDLVYDPYLAKFLSYTFPSEMMGARTRINLLNVNYYVEGGKMQEPLTVWDMFYRESFLHPKRFKQDYYVYNRKEILNTRSYGNAFFSKMDRIITVHNTPAFKSPYFVNGMILSSNISGYYRKPPETETKYPYFFTDEFYEGKGTETEMFVWNMFRDKVIDKQGVVDTLDKFWELDDRTKLYMAGIYIGACKQALINNTNL